MFDHEITNRIAAVARESDIEPISLLAVAEVESGGIATVLVNGRQEPLIRFEGHYFDRRLSAGKQRTARREGLSSPVAGAVHNPPTQAARWALLQHAAAIDHEAAYESTSWGLGQVMGAHWHALGYADVDALVAEVRGSVEGQIRLMLHYIDHFGLAGALDAHDWVTFARHYNGPAYRRYRYDEKIAHAWSLYHDRLTGSGNRSDPLRRPKTTTHAFGRGARGDAVRQLQRSLTALGYPLAPDGRFGPATGHMLRCFQHDSGLVEDGLAGPLTMKAIDRRLPSAGPDTKRMVSILGWIRRFLWVARRFFRARPRDGGKAMDKR